MPKNNNRVLLGYTVTGVTRNGKRFKMSYPATFAGYITATSINLWQGSVWSETTGNPRRQLMKRVWN